MPLSSDNRDTVLDIVNRTAAHCITTLTVSGGRQQVTDVRKLLLSATDKVAIQTASVRKLDHVSEAANKFGNQCYRRCDRR